MYYLFEIDDLTNLYAVFTAGVALVIAVLISAPPFWNIQKTFSVTFQCKSNLKTTARKNKQRAVKNNNLPFKSVRITTAVFPPNLLSAATQGLQDITIAADTFINAF